MLQSQKLLTSFKVAKDNEPKYFRVSVAGKEFSAELITDFQKTMEVTINNYYRDITDYSQGDFPDTIDWYLEIIKNVASGQYSVIEYKRGGKSICKYLIMAVRGKSLQIGDFKNHFKLFASRTENEGGAL